MNRPRALPLVAALVALVVAGCTSPGEPVPEPTPASEAPPSTSEPAPTTSEAAPEPEPTFGTGVSAGHPLAVEAGTEVLEAGGTAVDAAIAASFAVSVVEPFASGVGGGGAALVAGADIDPTSYDYREVVAQDGQIPESGTGVPGHVAGMAAMHADHGVLPWEELLQPAIELAAGGFAVSDFLALRMRSDYGPAAVQGSPVFAPSGTPLSAGDTLVQDELAATLRTIAEEGASSFSTGSLAERLTEVAGLDAETLADYEVVVDEPVSGDFAGHEVLSATPPLPGVALVQMLQVAEADGISDTEPGSAEYVESLSRAWLIGHETAHTVLGDPAFVDVPVGELTDPALNRGLASRGVGPSRPPGSEPRPPAPGNTTHLTVVDDTGLVVSMTNTITSFWGSGHTVGGFFLNNQLSRFETIPSAVNAPEPGARSVSWAAPTIVLDSDGAPVLGIGSPGGMQIPIVLANVIVRHVLHGQPLEDAVASPRFILGDGVLTAESHLSESAAAGAGSLGWSVRRVAVEQAVFGSVQALAVDPGTGVITGTADTRREAAVSTTEP